MAGFSSQFIKRFSNLFYSIRLTESFINTKCLFQTSAALSVDGVAIRMPSLSPTMAEGTIVKWMKKEGDLVHAGDVLCDIQTDKAVVALETEEEGSLAKIMVSEDSKEIKVGTLIALLAPEGEDWKSVTVPAGDVEGSHAAAEISTIAPDQSSEVKTHKQLGKFGPSVRLLLEQYGLSSADIPAGGPHGKLLKGDVLKLVQEKNLQEKTTHRVQPPALPTSPVPVPISPAVLKPKVVPEGGYTDMEVTNMRKTIAKRLTQAKGGIAHSYVTLDCVVDNILTLRKQMKSDGINVSVNDLIVKAVATALTRCPRMNCIWQGDELKFCDDADISIAVATEAGLITPIIRSANALGVMEIAFKIRELADRARQNKLKLDEFQGGTFTISNLGMFGITEFTAIINPPQCGILAVGGTRRCLDVSGKHHNRMSTTLSFDRLAVTDDEAASFMETLQSLLEDPSSILLGAYTARSHSTHSLEGLL